ncbi:AraC family transcriptional regulator [Paenibacillus barcinonensis]|uniref:AraC family transcriptional regulator n=1 Tax=Paenibacillus barcinonensis TaxID=198119 RepID=A0A2V4VCT3_PAEBA|nr:helix-turn-helix domain-containing protein [Paenibacillus barcinonensis]PYE42680.1 AraC-like DNA-binding protein [Paenibacillus barcinonensis]QKS58879.1 AraC family transcriptional regulator [Paenibacillus barcinonensis]
MHARLHSLYRPVQINGLDPRTYYIEHAPSPSLAPYAACYWESGTRNYIENDEYGGEAGVWATEHWKSATSARILPDGCTDILIHYDAEQARYSYSYCGNYTQPFAFPLSFAAPPAGAYTFGVRFFPGGAPFLHGQSLDLFTDRRIPLEDCWPLTWDDLRGKMEETVNFAARVQVMDQYLSQMTLRNSCTQADQDLLQNVLYRIFRNNGRASVQDIAKSEVISERQLHRKVTEQVGISPKRFSEIVRFHQVMHGIRAGQFTDGVTLAQQYGFYDQAHLIRQFRKFYGDTPMTAVREQQLLLSEKYNLSPASSVILGV